MPERKSTAVSHPHQECIVALHDETVSMGPVPSNRSRRNSL